MNLPFYIIKEIITILFKNKKIPYKYRLSLVTISKKLFKGISQDRAIKLHLNCNLNPNLIRNVNKHLESEWCIVKRLSLNGIVIEVSDCRSLLEEEIKRFFSKVEKMIIDHHLYHSIPKFEISDIFLPNLKKLVVYRENILNIQCRITVLKLTIDFEDLMIGSLINLLEGVKSTVTEISIIIIYPSFSNHVSNQLDNYLLEYKPMNPLIVFNLFFASNHIKSILQRHIHSLRYLKNTIRPFRFKTWATIDDILDLISESQSLTNLEIEISNEISLNRLFETLNDTPNIISLKLDFSIVSYSDLGLNSVQEELFDENLPIQWQAFKFIKYLDVKCHPNYFNFFLKYNSSNLSQLKEVSSSRAAMLSFFSHAVSFDGLIGFLSSNLLLTSIDIHVYLDELTREEIENLSLVISQHPNLSSITFVLVNNRVGVKSELFKHLHQSNSLQYITLDNYGLEKASDDFRFYNPNHPFQFVSKNYCSYAYIRNGIHYDKKSKISLLVNYVKDKWRSFNKYYS